jgi:hypothetical protein
VPGELLIRRGATIPEDRRTGCPSSVCLAPHGVCLASRITPRAVSSYLAFSPLPRLFSKNRRCLFCDTFRHRDFTIAMPACFTRHAAVWCSDFPLASLPAHQRSPTINKQHNTFPSTRESIRITAEHPEPPECGRVIVPSHHERGRAHVSCSCIRKPGHAALASTERLRALFAVAA